MKKVIFVMLVLASCAPLFARQLGSAAGRDKYKPEVLVTYKETFTAEDIRQISEKYGPGADDRDSAISMLERGYGMKRLRESSSGVVFVCYGVGVTAAVETAADALKKEPIVEHAQPNYLFYALYISAASGPIDPAYQQHTGYKPPGSMPASSWEQWGLWQTRVDRAYGAGLIESNGASSNEVVVAVLDTGITSNHEDLIGVTMTGKNFINPFLSPDDDDTEGGHGTHCSGIIAANTGNLSAGNPTGMAGVAYANVSWTTRTRIMPVKVLDSSGAGDDAAIAEAIIWAADSGAKVINMSFGGTSADNILQQACAYASQKGCLLVAAAGNDGFDTNYPAAYASVMSVAATELLTDGYGRTTDAKAYFSSHGKIDVAAPGVAILSTANNYDPEGNSTNCKYSSWNGTSFAAPLVSGLAALIWMKYPGYTAERVRDVIEQTADDAGDAGYDEKFGWGRINAYRALTLDKKSASTGGLPVKTYNWPNPFSPEDDYFTNIVFIPETASDTQVLIYDAGGDPVWEKTAAKSDVTAGVNNTVRWDGKDKEGREVANGVYFYIVKTDGGKYGKNKIVVLY